MKKIVITLSTKRGTGNEWIEQLGLNTKRPFSRFVNFINVADSIKSYEAILNIFDQKEMLVVEIEAYKSLQKIFDYLILISKTEEDTEISYMEFNYEQKLQAIRHSKSS